MYKFDCVFCGIARGVEPCTIVKEWEDAIAIVPLAPAAPGHTLVIPRWHVDSAVDDPDITAATMRYASEYAKSAVGPCNIITSVGRWATQTVMHLHIHVIPRGPQDGLPTIWPWMR